MKDFRDKFNNSKIHQAPIKKELEKNPNSKKPHKSGTNRSPEIIINGFAIVGILVVIVIVVLRLPQDKLTEVLTLLGGMFVAIYGGANIKLG